MAFGYPQIAVHRFPPRLSCRRGSKGSRARRKPFGDNCPISKSEEVPATNQANSSETCGSTLVESPFLEMVPVEPLPTDPMSNSGRDLPFTLGSSSASARVAASMVRQSAVLSPETEAACRTL